MNPLKRLLAAIDRFQRRHAFAGFPYGVVKKYGDDQAGYQAALVTYYGFLSLFPLLLVLTTVAGIIGEHNPAFGHKLVTSASSYFPVVGNQLDRSVHGMNRNGLQLVIGLLFTLYGARGVAEAFRQAVNHVWHVPVADRGGFPKSVLRDLGIIAAGGIGFIAAAIISGIASAAGHGWVLRVVSVVINLVILSLTFVAILKLSLPEHIGWKQLRTGAITAVVGLTILQIAGGYIVTHQAKGLSSSYSALFATTLGLLAWIYLQAQIMMYAVEVETVRGRRLWPRSLTGDDLTEADRQTYRGEAKKEKAVDKESVRADFRAD